jgi:glycosyltransferase involved in cell wall biosynthesis
MRLTVYLFGGLLALGWAGIAADYASGAAQARSLDTEPPFADGDSAPALSVVVAACNEEDKLPAAFRTLLAQDYPGRFEIVAVDDRSIDATPALLDTLAREAPPGMGVTVLHLTDLPPGWLGKNHALYQGARRATGTYLLFTDADIRFAPDTLSRALHYAERENLDHLASFFRLDLRGFWENAFGLCFSLLFFLRFRPWRVRDPRTSNYLGIGGFNLVRRDAYDAIGTHRALALDVTDDMELGRLLKHAGFRSDVIGSAHHVVVRWQEGLSGLMGGLVKNAYAGLRYSPSVLWRSAALLLVTVVWPFVALVALRRGRAGYAASVALVLGIGGYHARTGGIPPAYALTLPVTTLLLIGVMFRSAWVTERSGGITWRGAFYPLDALRTAAIPPVADIEIYGETDGNRML